MEHLVVNAQWQKPLATLHHAPHHLHESYLVRGNVILEYFANPHKFCHHLVQDREEITHNHHLEKLRHQRNLGKGDR